MDDRQPMVPIASLLFFRTDWCGVCHEKVPVARKIAEILHLPLEVVDTEAPEGRDRARELRISMVPTLALVQGPRVRFRLVGRMITPENALHLTAATRGSSGS